MRRRLLPSLLLALGLALAGCASLSTPAPVAVVPAEARSPVTVLVSIDGMRADYLDRGITPRMTALAGQGVRAAMRPSFPTITFPNHYSLVTGLRPDRHGIVGNRMEDPAQPGQVFTMATDRPAWWTEAEPIWITAERGGVRTATMFWPGSNVDHGGMRPRDWWPFGQAVSNRQRVDAIVDYLRRPADTRPRFLTLYFDAVDTAGHAFGPDDPRTNAEVAQIDGEIGRLVDALAALGQPANLIIVADHGMAATAPDRVINLHQLMDPVADYRLVTQGAYAGVEPLPGREAAVAAALLRDHRGMDCYRKADIPARLAYGRHPRVPSFVCIAELGWYILGAPPPPDRPFTAGGAHGYDQAHREMDALFLAAGPAIRTGARVETFDNVHVYPLLARLIGIEPRPSDGDPAVLAPILAE